MIEGIMYITDKELDEVRDFLSRENLEIGGWLATKAYQMMLEIKRLNELVKQREDEACKEWTDGFEYGLRNG